MSFTLQPRIRTMQGHKRPPLTTGPSLGGRSSDWGFCIRLSSPFFRDGVGGGSGGYSLRYSSGRLKKKKKKKHSSWIAEI